MTSVVSYYGFLAHRRRRSAFLGLAARPVPSGSLMAEVGRALAALGGLALWIVLVVLLAA
jgi:hypothetical protein